MLASPSSVGATMPLPGNEYGSTIAKSEFALFQALIYKEAGIHLPDTKRALLVRRLSGRLRALKLKSFAAYYRRIVKEGDAEERVRMLDCITTNETSFFREPRQFEFLEQKLIPAWKKAADAGQRLRLIRVWSAACATGEEPFSVAMTLLHHLPPALGWKIDILATDLSTQVLDRGRKAIWPTRKVGDIPQELMKRFMLRGRGSQEGNVKARRSLRSVIRFRHLNLHHSPYEVGARFDLILCRNVLIYFDAKSKAGVVQRLLHHLSADGYFFVGHAESLLSLSNQLRSVIPTVYRFANAEAEV